MVGVTTRRVLVPAGGYERLQAGVVAWVGETFPAASTLSTATHLGDEARELLEAAHDWLGETAILEEAADVLILSCSLAARLGLTLPVAAVWGMPYAAVGGIDRRVIRAETLILAGRVGAIGDLAAGDPVPPEYLPALRLLLAQVVAGVIRIAEALGCNLGDAAEIKLERNRRRAWGKPDGRGVVRHIGVG